MTTKNKETELCSLLDSLINFELSHYSHPETPVWQKYEQGVGKSITNLICIVKAASLPNIDEKEVDDVFKVIRKAFLTIAVEAFRKTKAYEKVQFGNGVTDKEKVAYEMVLVMFELAIARISQQKFIFLFQKLITFFPEEVPNDNADFKTILQEYMQKKGLTLPRYEVSQVEGPPHNQVFKVSCLVSDGKTFKGNSVSKKKAEMDAASVACNYYEINPKPIKIAEEIQLNPSYNDKILYENQRLSKVFGLPDRLNLISAFLHPRLKNKFGLKDCSNRRLATVGAAYIQYCVHQVKLELFKNSMLTNCIETIISNASISESSLIKIFETNMVQKADIPFIDHQDFYSLSYQADCIQSLFGMSFYHFINTDDSEPIYKTQVSDWISKIIQDICRSHRKLNNDITSIALLRYQSIGFVYTRIKLTDSWGIKLQHIRTGSEYELIYKGDLTNKKEVIKSLSGILLKAIDRFEGVQFC